jgi:hypothetical protein
MECVNKAFVLLLVVVLFASSFAIIGFVSAQSLKPVVTEFWLQYVDSSYDVAPSATSTKDLYTGEVTTSTIPGYRVENKSIVVTIRNPHGVDAYNFRWKDHNSNVWNYEPFDPDRSLPLRVADGIGIRANASSSEYTVLSLIFIPKTHTFVDIQVQALYGDYRAIPYGTALGLPTWDFYFDGQASYWSHTESIDVTNTEVYLTSTPAPTVPPTPLPTVTSTEHPTAAPTQVTAEWNFALTLNWEDAALAVACAVIAVLAVALVLSRRGGATKNA